MRYKYELIRTPRKSISISISNDNKIVVRAPWSVHISEIEKYLASKAVWMDKIILRNAKLLAENDDVLEYRQILFQGKRLPLIISDRNEITSEAVYIKNLGEVEQLFTRCCSEEFLNTVQTLSNLTLFKPSTVTIKSYRGRWGCCDGKNNIAFNYRLFMLPARLQRYVIIHELCHILCHNHSEAFWKLVSDYEPQYKTLKKQLSNYDFLTSLY